MAMGQGEQRAIHPLFRKDFAISTASLSQSPVNDSVLCHSSPTSANKTHICNGSSVSQTAVSVATLDHDPNTDRRKRRKTNKSPTQQLANGRLSTDNGCNNPGEREPAVASSRTPEPCKSIFQVEVPPTSEKEDQTQPSLPQDTALTHAEPIAESDSEKKRKVIKLNPNGKLLSSPVANTFDDQSKTRKGNRRGKPQPQIHEDREKKLVVIKYVNQEGSLNSLGKQIDDILSGRKKHTSSSAVVRPTATTPTANLKRPLKPTHPFFLKRAIQKPDESIPQSHGQESVSAAQDDEQARRTELPAQARPMLKQPFSFKYAFAKIPEPIQPLWPPLGLAHVRDISDKLEPLYGDPYPLELDHRKSKMPAVRISDEESVLLSIMKTAARDTARVLRIPEKQVASGRVLQATIARQLNGQPTKSIINGVDPNESFHPAVAKLYSSLPVLMTAFDRGEYNKHLWAHKYAPNSAQQVLCATKEALVLRDWLKHLIVSTVETGQSSKDNEKSKRKDERKRKRRKNADKLYGFIVSSDDEASEMGEISDSDDELAGGVTVSSKRTVIRTGDLTFSLKSDGGRGRMANTILLSGPPGCGKTASVYAVAKEMDFEVFEINAGNRRSAKDILDKIGDMTQNHLVHNVQTNENPSNNQSSATDLQSGELEDTKQNKLMGFFKASSTGSLKEGGRGPVNTTVKGADAKRTRSQKQSLILLEEADLLFEEDKQFWSGVLTLINQSKRPIIITCNDENLIPINDISFHAILRYRVPPPDLAVDYLLLMAANEGHVLKRTAIEKLYLSTGKDLRKSIMELNYWCQMAVGSEKSGLDWMIDRWPIGSDLDSNGDKMRVLSTDTYQDYMGWFSRDIIMSDCFASEVELQEELLHWWQLSLQEADNIDDSKPRSWLEPSPGASNLELLETLRRQSDYMESRSVFDSLAAACSLDPRMDAIDSTLPPMSEKQKLNYIEGYQLLKADHIPDYTTLTVDLGSTIEVLLGQAYRPKHGRDFKTKQAEKVLAANPRPQAICPKGIELFDALAAVMKPDCTFAQPNGRVDGSVEHNLRAVAEDFTPYVRAIVAFDLRLEQHRLELSRLLSGDGKGTKRIRTTRASRAALEGGNKAATRKERWFSPSVNIPQILSTGKKEWQDLLIQHGYLTMPAAGDRRNWEGSEPTSDGTSDGYT